MKSKLCYRRYGWKLNPFINNLISTSELDYSVPRLPRDRSIPEYPPGITPDTKVQILFWSESAFAGQGRSPSLALAWRWHCIRTADGTGNGFGNIKYYRIVK